MWREVLAETGDVDRARQVAQQAEAVARSITDPSEQAWALAGVAEALARTGDVDRAEAVGRPSLTLRTGGRRWLVWQGL